MYRSTRQEYWKKLPNISDTLAVFVANLSYISARSVLATLVVFISIPIFILKELKTQMKIIRRHQNRNSPPILSLHLDNWRKHHDIACSSVDDINFCFGPCLLIYLIFASNVFVRYPCWCIIQYQWGAENDLIGSYILQVAVVLINFLVILYPAQKLKSEVQNVRICLLSKTNAYSDISFL